MAYHDRSPKRNGERGLVKKIEKKTIEIIDEHLKLLNGYVNHELYCISISEHKGKQLIMLEIIEK